MSKSKRKPTVSDVLRRAIRESGEPLLRIERATDVHRASISRFLRGERSLVLTQVDKLAAYLGIECRRVRRRKG